MKSKLSEILLVSALLGGLDSPGTAASGGGTSLRSGKRLPQSQWKKRKKKIKMQKQSRRKQR